MLSKCSALEEIQNRVLWLATNMIHHANKVRPNASGIKVGGHQASSASVATILTELFFDFMSADDKLSVKPHASPVLHAIQYLLGNLDRHYLTELRAFHGLQAYPSRTKDPDPIDFSTGSVGLGSVAPNFAALADRFTQAHFGQHPDQPRRRFISLLGDAELDEGSIWEAVAEPALAGLDNLIWIVDVNRQSLDRVVPGIRIRQLEAMFAANGWTVVEAKYGRRLQTAFAEPNGERLRLAIDQMSNEQYQLLLRSPVERIADVLGDATPDVPHEDLRELIGDLGGHDFTVLRDALAVADGAPGPAVVFAFTVKGWGLHFAGDPLNHAALLTDADMLELRQKLAVPTHDAWATLAPESLGGQLATERSKLFKALPKPTPWHSDLPDNVSERYVGKLSTQQVFGQVMTGLARLNSEAVSRIVTVSPDVATSTNLGGWINRVGVWESAPHSDLFAEEGPRLINWKRHPAGQHIELGISETNLLMLLGQLGLARELFDEPLLPVGTLYDPFIARALDAFMYSVYSGARFILAGTPSGITLAPEGGAHQSILTPNVGLAIPNVTYWEPCFARELEWILIHALRSIHQPQDAESSYLRLSTLPVDQSLFPETEDQDALRRKVLSGAYVIRDMSGLADARPGNRVDIWACGVMVATALQASEELLADGVFASVYNCVSPGLVYRSWQRSVHGAMEHLSAMSAASGAPVVTVIDGHPSALSWIGSMLGVKAYPLGVSDFGQSGLPQELHSHFSIDQDAICYAAYVALGGRG